MWQHEIAPVANRLMPKDNGQYQKNSKYVCPTCGNQAADYEDIEGHELNLAAERDKARREVIEQVRELEITTPKLNMDSFHCKNAELELVTVRRQSFESFGDQLNNFLDQLDHAKK